MSELSEKKIEDVIRKIISQTTVEEGETATSDDPSELSKLQRKVDSFLQSPAEFETGDVVKWKKGLKNKKYPEENQCAIVIQQLKEPIIQGERESGSPYFREPLDLILGFLDPDDGDLVLFHYDKRRFDKIEPVK